MAFPSVRSSVVTAGSTAALNPVVNLPATISAGDTLLVAIRSTGLATYTWPVGWTELFQSSADASDDAWSVGGTVTIDTNVTERFAALAWAIQDAADPTVTPPTVSSIISASTLTPNPPSLDTGASKDYLWFSIASSEGENTFSSYSTNYTLGQLNTSSGSAGAVANNCRIAGSARQLATQTEDPGVITWTGTADDTMSVTIAIHPAVVQFDAWKFATTRVRVIATAWRDAVTRIRSSIRAFKDATARIPVDIRGFKDTSVRISSVVGAFKDANVRIASAIQAFQDAAIRIAVESGVVDVYKDAVSRVRLRLSQSASPNLDFFNDGWTTHLGGSTQLYQRIDELARDDADYIRSVLDPVDDLVVFAASSLKDPGDNNGLRMRFAMGKSGAGGTAINLEVQLRTLSGAVGTRTFNDVSGDLTEFAIVWTPSEVDDFRAGEGFSSPYIGFRATSS
jgi:hypothetical protein